MSLLRVTGEIINDGDEVIVTHNFWGDSYRGVVLKCKPEKFLYVITYKKDGVDRESILTSGSNETIRKF